MQDDTALPNGLARAEPALARPKRGCDFDYASCIAEPVTQLNWTVKVGIFFSNVFG